MTNPLAPVFEWWLSFILCLPASFMAYISFTWAVAVGLAVFMALWRAKH